MPVTREVAYEAAAQYRVDDEGPVRALIDEAHVTPPGQPLLVQDVDGEWSPPVRNGWWIVRWTERDYTVMSAGEYDRMIGDSPSPG